MPQGDAQVTAREARIAELENVIQLRNTALADTTIAAAVSRGILLAQPARASKEEAIKLRWHKRIVEEGEDAAEMLNAIPGATEHLTQSLTTSRAEDGSIVPFRGSVPLSSVLRGMKPEVLTCSAEVARERGLIYNRALICLCAPDDRTHHSRVEMNGAETKLRPAIE